VSGGDLFGGGVNEPDDGDGEPGNGERAVEVADALASTTNVPAGMDISSSGRVSGPRVHPTRA
jgi:hypothetical protein